jgi:hypothetical protein
VLSASAAHHHSATVHHPYALVGGFVIGLVALAVTIRPLTHPVLRDVLAAVCWIGAATLLFVAFVPYSWQIQVLSALFGLLVAVGLDRARDHYKINGSLFAHLFRVFARFVRRVIRKEER